jgi:acetyl esterase/lipase
MMIRQLCAIASVTLATITAGAQKIDLPKNPPPISEIPAPEEKSAFPLYPEGAPALQDGHNNEAWGSVNGAILVRNVTVPTLTPFLPDPAKATGAAVIVAPGGGFVSLAINYEGWDAARWLADHGVAAFVLKYRLTPSPDSWVELRKWEAVRNEELFSGKIEPFPPSIQDAVQAIRLVRSRAHSFGIDPDKIGMLGFSAGAIATFAVALQNEEGARPSFIGVIYPPQDSNQVYGPKDPIRPPSNAPPMFDALAADDILFGKTSFGIVQAWRAAGAKVELHYYQAGNHGFGMNKNGTTTELWPEEFLAWLKLNQFVPANTPLQ